MTNSAVRQLGADHGPFVIGLGKYAEPISRLELETCGLRNRCSTTELNRPGRGRIRGERCESRFLGEGFRKGRRAGPAWAWGLPFRGGIGGGGCYESAGGRMAPHLCSFRALKRGSRTR